MGLQLSLDGMVGSLSSGVSDFCYFSCQSIPVGEYKLLCGPADGLVGRVHGLNIVSGSNDIMFGTKSQLFLCSWKYWNTKSHHFFLLEHIENVSGTAFWNTET